MKRSFYTVYSMSIVALALITMPMVYSARFAQGNGTYPQTFATQVNVTTFDPTNGTIYCGIQGTTTTGSGLYAVSKAYRNYINAPFKVVPLPSGSSLSNRNIYFLDIATSLGIPARTLAGSSSVARTSSSIPTPPATVFALSSDGKTVVTSSTLLDASGDVDENGAATNGVIGLSASEQFIFTALRPSGITAIWGELNSGIGVVRINYNEVLYPFNLSSVVQTAAVAGDAGTKAKKLDTTTIEAFSPASQTAAKITEPPTTASVGVPQLITTNPLFWDDPLQRLYIGLIDTSGTGAANNVMRSVVVGRITDLGILTYSAIAPNTAITSALAADQNEIVAGKASDSSAEVFNLTALNLRVLHASTGPSYLIVNGNNGTPADAGRFIFALPLVDKRDEDGFVSPADEATHGTLAAKNSALVNNKFVTPATIPGQLVQDPTNGGGATDVFALVGGAQLPFYLSDGATTFAPSDIVVSGDTVYVSINVTQSDTNDTGLLYSQAQFDASGKICGWTPWAKRGFPIDAIPDVSNPGTVDFFEVDAVTGDVWAIGDDQGQTLALTQWDRGTTPTSLVSKLNKALSDGSYSSLDLNAYTRGFDTNTAYRYALFGGVNKVMFALISHTIDLTDLTAPAPQQTVEDYSDPENLHGSMLPQPGGDVTVLEYSRNSTANSNYFFAGTQHGLFVFANGTSGFTVSSLATVDTAPISTGNWQYVSALEGSITDIKSLGNSLYVLTFTTSRTQPMKSILYRIPYASTTTAMFASSNIYTIAETNVGIFSDISYFSAIRLIPIATTSTTEQLVLATNAGIFESTTVGGVQTATTQTLADWEIIDTSDRAMYYGIAAVNPSLLIYTTFETSSPHTVWPISVRDAARLRTYDRGGIQQLNGTDVPLSFSPTQFNGTGTNAAITTLPAITSLFSDGARRFFIIKRPEDRPSINRIMVAPYNDAEWAVINPEQNILFNAQLPTELAYFWVNQIGMSGILMAGVNNGVLGLE